MGNINMRLNASDERFFSPDRDLAYCTPHLVHRAISGLDPGRREYWVEEYLKKNNVKEEDLVKAAECLANYFNTAVFDPTFKQPFESLEATGFFDLPQEAQVVVMGKIGQVYISAFFSSVRDVTRDPTKPPIDTKILADAAKDLLDNAAWYNNIPWWRRWLFHRIKDLKVFLGLV